MEKITIIHPSRQRPVRCIQTALDWLTRATQRVPIQYVISIDEDEPLIDEYKALIQERLVPYINQTSVFQLVIMKYPNKSAIEAINNAAKHSDYDLLIVVSDDFECFPNWDLFLERNLQGKEDYIVKTSDGIQDWLITLPIMDRKYYERFGYIYYPEYKHLFCDTEMTAVADLLGRKIDLRSEQYVFRHLHPCAGLSEADEINRKNDATWQQGETLYNERKKINFGLNV